MKKKGAKENPFAVSLKRFDIFGRNYSYKTLLGSFATFTILAFVITYLIQEIFYMVNYQKDIISSIHKPKNTFDISRSYDQLEIRVLILMKFDIDPS